MGYASNLARTLEPAGTEACCYTTNYFADTRWAFSSFAALAKKECGDLSPMHLASLELTTRSIRRNFRA